MPGLPEAYIQTPNKVKDYLQTMLKAEAPERFTQDFMERLGFKSANDRAWIGVLKELGFLDLDGKPSQRYYAFLDRGEWKRVLAQGIRDAFSDLFAINVNANSLSRDEVKNKLRTLYQGKKTDRIIDLIASTFDSLVREADFSGTINNGVEEREQTPRSEDQVSEAKSALPGQKMVKFGALQYQINITLPATRDQAVYDAIFKSLREHLG
jgi:hypothetical protein